MDLNTDCLLNFRPQTKPKHFHWLNRQKVQTLDPTMLHLTQKQSRDYQLFLLPIMYNHDRAACIASASSFVDAKATTGRPRRSAAAAASTSSKIIRSAGGKATSA